MSTHTHMLSEQNHRLAAKMLEQQGELNRAKARVAELEACVFKHLEERKLDARINRHKELVERAEKAEARVAELKESEEKGWQTAATRGDTLSRVTIERDEAHARVAELEGDKTAGLDMIRDRLDADPSTVAEAVEGLIGLYKIEFDQRVELEGEITELHGVGKRRTAAHADLQAQLERAKARNSELEKMDSQLRDRVVRAEVSMRRATEPRADGSEHE